jgi:uncharacterized membrane protein YeaQ/YmgE (transglycosylase-associated protein family)
MSSAIVNLIIQLVAGIAGGNAAGASLKDYDLGTLGNTIAGAIGGAGGGQILQAFDPRSCGRGRRAARRWLQIDTLLAVRQNSDDH